MGRFFSYTSTLLDPSTRVSTVAGVSTQRYQIPNNPGQPTLSQLGTFPGMTVYGIGNYQSSNLNENQYETNAYAVAAWQRSVATSTPKSPMSRVTAASTMFPMLSVTCSSTASPTTYTAAATSTASRATVPIGSTICTR